jgi:hypothetical protein
MKLNLKFKKMKLPVNYEKLSQRQRRAVREEYVRRQNGLCHYCKNPLNKKQKHTRPLYMGAFPPNFFKHPVHLHHCHKTGMTIGAVHNYCNAVLWQYHGE